MSHKSEVSEEFARLLHLVLGTPLPTPTPQELALSTSARRAQELLDEVARRRTGTERFTHVTPFEEAEHLVFDLELRQGSIYWTTFLTRPNKRDPDRLVKGKEVSWWERHGWRYAAESGEWTIADLLGLALALSHREYSSALPPRWVGAALAAIVQSGRSFWGDHTYGVRLQWTPETPVLAWHWQRDARDRFVGAFALPESHAHCRLVQNTEPWAFVDVRGRTVGFLAPPPGMSWREVRALLAWPALLAEEIEPLARRWAELFPALPLPVPVEREIIDASARFVLYLQRNEQGKRVVLPRVQYGPVTVQPSGHCEHPFPEHVQVQLPQRSLAREREWWQAIERWVSLSPQGEAERGHLHDVPSGTLTPHDDSPRAWLERRRQLSAFVAPFAAEVKAEPDFWPQEWIADTVEVSLTPTVEPDWFEWGGSIRAGKDWNLPIEDVAAEVFERYGTRDWPEELVLEVPQQDAVARIPLSAIEPVLRVAVELLAREPRRGTGRLRLSRFDVGLMAQLPENVPLPASSALTEMLEVLRRDGAPSAVAPPAMLTAELRPYQREGLAWLQFWRRHGLHGVLADDMGLGKTVQALAHLAVEKEARRLHVPALVIAPTSLIGNWQREAARYVPGLKVMGWQGAQRALQREALAANDLVVTSYALLWRDVEVLAAQPWSVVVLDEAQAIKNPRAKVAAAARRLRAEQRLCLTGTPMENHLGELWAIYDFLMPGFLGSHEVFQRHYRTPIEKHGDAPRLEFLRRRIRPFFLRRTKSEVAKDLPPKTEIVETLTLGERQAKVYEAIRLSMQARVREALAKRGLAKSQITVLDALLKLRQVCCDPTLVKVPQAQRVKEAVKLEWLRETLPELIAEGRRVLVFSQFVELIDRIEPIVQELAIPYARFTGQTRDRDAVVAKFQGGEVPLLLISLKAGGTGLNLTAADTVILVDPWWNPAVEAQAIDRTHRIGQDKPVFIYKLIVANTVEEQMLALQEKKRALADATYGTAGAAKVALSEEDIAALFNVTPLGT